VDAAADFLCLVARSSWEDDSPASTPVTTASAVALLSYRRRREVPDVDHSAERAPIARQRSPLRLFVLICDWISVS